MFFISPQQEATALPTAQQQRRQHSAAAGSSLSIGRLMRILILSIICEQHIMQQAIIAHSGTQDEEGCPPIIDGQAQRHEAIMEEHPIAQQAVMQQRSSAAGGRQPLLGTSFSLAMTSRAQVASFFIISQQAIARQAQQDIMHRIMALQFIIDFSLFAISIDCSRQSDPIVEQQHSRMAMHPASPPIASVADGEVSSFSAVRRVGKTSVRV